MNRIPNIESPSCGDIEYALELLDIPYTTEQVLALIPTKDFSLHSIIDYVGEHLMDSEPLGHGLFEEYGNG